MLLQAVPDPARPPAILYGVANKEIFLWTLWAVLGLDHLLPLACVSNGSGLPAKKPAHLFLLRVYTWKREISSVQPRYLLARCQHFRSATFFLLRASNIAGTCLWLCRGSLDANLGETLPNCAACTDVDQGRQDMTQIRLAHTGLLPQSATPVGTVKSAHRLCAPCSARCLPGRLHIRQGGEWRPLECSRVRHSRRRDAYICAWQRCPRAPRLPCIPETYHIS
jgi:hypothetical protein